MTRTKRSMLTGALPLALLSLATPAMAKAPAAHQRFAALTRRYLDALARTAPVSATTLGDHRFDTQIGDYSAAARAREVAGDRAMLADLARIDRARLTRDEQVDAALIDNALRYDIWQITVERDWHWNLQYWNDTAAGALYGLAARDFAPWSVRMHDATLRMEALPAFLAMARATIDPAAVPPVFAETVSKQNGGILEIAEGLIAPHRDALPEGERARFDAALAGLKAAVATQQHWLDTVVKPAARGDFRLGAAKYDQKMRFALMSDITRPQLEARARAAFADTRAQMYAIARQVLAGRAGAPPLPADPTPAQQQAAISAALDLTYAHRPARDGLMDAAKAALARETAFVRDHDLVTVPDTPVNIITMPKFQQGNAVAYCDPPGPLDRNLPTFFAISPIPAEWSDAQATSFLTEYNDYMIQDLAAHEAMPGHYLQLAHANADPSVVRAVLMSGPFVEGWAVYGEGMMADAGYMDDGDTGGIDGPLFRLTVLKMRLRSITNTLLDIGIQTGGMTRDQAMDLMMKGAFQQEREAAGKWIRASLSSVQLLSYFTGYSEHMALRAEAKRRWGTAFTLKRYNDAVLAHGSPPAKFVRELMFGLPVG